MEDERERAGKTPQAKRHELPSPPERGKQNGRELREGEKKGSVLSTRDEEMARGERRQQKLSLPEGEPIATPVGQGNRRQHVQTQQQSDH